MSKLYILGGRQRNPGFKEPGPLDEWSLYEAALIVELDTETLRLRTCVEYQSPPQVLAGSKPSAHFHGGVLIGKSLYTCTKTEVMCYALPEFSRVCYLSLPCFNDLHHVTVSSDGNLLVANTGLEMVLKLTPQGKILAAWNVLGGDAWETFSRDVDYRKVASTKPHKSHPNFVFELDGEIWVTRFHQRDAVSLNGSHRRMDLAGEFPHDGLIVGDLIYFTAVDGKIVIVSRTTLRVQEVVDLRAIQDGDGVKLPAWCRGILPLDERKVWVGFSRIRKTKFQENVRWVKRTLGEGTLAKPTHIALFDISQSTCLQEIELESYGINAVYGIFAGDREHNAYSSVPQNSAFNPLPYYGVNGEIDTGVKLR